ncbi:MAG: hypothetical protein Fur0044_51360 [Anaerolineae bacterium]
MTLEIKDDGQGFDPQSSFSGRLGLHSMRERTEKLGGRFELASQSGQGTTVRVWLPVKSSPSLSQLSRYNSPAPSS